MPAELRQNLGILLPVGIFAFFVFSGCIQPGQLTCSDNADCSTGMECDGIELVCVSSSTVVAVAPFAFNPDPIFFTEPFATPLTVGTSPEMAADWLYEDGEIQVRELTMEYPGGADGFQLSAFPNGPIGRFEYYNPSPGFITRPVIADGPQQAYVDVDEDASRDAWEPEVTVVTGPDKIFVTISVPVGGDGSAAEKLYIGGGGARLWINAGLMTLPLRVGGHVLVTRVVSVDLGTGDSDDGVDPGVKENEVIVVMYVTSDGPNPACGNPTVIPEGATRWWAWNREIGHPDGPFAIPGAPNPDGLPVVDPATLEINGSGGFINGHWADPDDCHDIHLHTNGYDPFLQHIDPAPCITCDLYNYSACGHGCIVYENAPPICGDGTLDPEIGEQCDDGNLADGDGCSRYCQLEMEAICGDGLTDPGEACDDGNTIDGDGCNGVCLVEAGFGCSDNSQCESGVCTSGLCEAAAVCGDGVIGNGESCDDANAADGDGCSSTCSEESGWSCGGEPSLCDETCGDGLIVGGESCDDANTGDGDGCSSTCAEESGWSCGGEPSLCDETCGDGLIVGGESCDDGNVSGGDGCGAVCQVEMGYECSGEPSVCTETCQSQGNCGGGEQCSDGNECASGVCTEGVCEAVAVCGDGLIGIGESCDDGNVSGGDGCGAVCQVETGYECGGEPSLCSETCGDGLIVGVETCDDANTGDGDGCSSTCTEESGWSCGGEPSLCDETCGDGLIVGSETCDDANTGDGDGCSSTCAEESGWSCSGEPSTCSQNEICGDGLIGIGESCDDGNAVDSDGCDAMCQVETGYECSSEPSVCTPARPPIPTIWPIDIRLGTREGSTLFIRDHNGALKGAVPVSADNVIDTDKKLVVVYRYDSFGNNIDSYDWSDGIRGTVETSDTVVDVIAAKNQFGTVEADGFPSTGFSIRRYSTNGKPFDDDIVTQTVPRFVQNEYHFFVLDSGHLQPFANNSNEPSGPPITVDDDAVIDTTSTHLVVGEDEQVRIFAPDMSVSGEPIITDHPAALATTDIRIWVSLFDDSTGRYRGQMYDESGQAVGEGFFTDHEPNLAATRDHVMVADGEALSIIDEDGLVVITALVRPEPPADVIATEDRFITIEWDDGNDIWVAFVWRPDGNLAAGPIAAGSADGDGGAGSGYGGGSGGGGGGGNGGGNGTPTNLLPVPGAIKLGGVSAGSGLVPGALISIDQGTITGTLLGDDVTPGGLTGLGYTASGLFGSTIFGPGSTSTLVKLNPGTGTVESEVAIVDPAGQGISIGDLAVQPSSNRLFAIRSATDGQGLAGLLYTIDPATGMASLIGDTTEDAGGAIGFAPDGTLYQTTHRTESSPRYVLNTLDPMDGSVILSVPLDQYYDGMVVRPNDGLICVTPGGSDEVWSIDPSTGEESYGGRTLTPEGATVEAALGDLEFVPLP